MIGNKVIKDSGSRREFESGAVRDNGNKGRCDLLPLGTCVAIAAPEKWHTLSALATYMETGDADYLHQAAREFVRERWGDMETALLELSVHFADGAAKYSPNNWKKGIPTSSFIDSGIRHYLKWSRGDDDEPHDRACLWNIVCAAWTCFYLPQLNSFAKEAGDESD